MRQGPARALQRGTMKAVTVEAMRALDAQAGASGISGYTLMERAGRGAYREMLRALELRLPVASRQTFTVLAGKGNNGGDAYVVARCLAEAGYATTVYAVCAPGELSGEARAHAACLPPQVPVQVVDQLPVESLGPGQVVVDGLLGTGFRGALRPPYERLLTQVNAAGCPVVALDIPSGLDGDTGLAEGVAIEAGWTVTMGLPKRGLLTASGLRHCGCLRCVDLGFPEGLVEAAPAAGPEAIMLQDARLLVGRRPRDAHKGVFGHVLVVGGSGLYGGAPFLAAGGAARAGAGLVTVAIPIGCQLGCAVPASLIVRRLADDGAGCFGQASVGPLAALAAGRTAIVFGPGLGDASEGREVLAQAIGCGLPLVVDADGLRLLAAQPSLALAARAAMVLTPHPGEMRVLLKGFGCPVALSDSRPEQALALAAASGAVVVLKGLGTVVATPAGRLAINTSGTPALATAGTGDVLAGIIGALLGQGLAGWDAARLGVFVHGLAAEAGLGAERSMTADDLVERLPAAWSVISPLA